MNKCKVNNQISDMVSKFITPALQVIIEDAEIHRHLESTILQKTNIASEKIKDFLVAESENISKAFDSIGEILPSLVTSEELEQIKKECFEAGKKVLTGQVTLFADKTQEEESLHKILGISDSTVEYLYTTGTLLYEQDRLLEAKYVLNIVTFLNPFVSLYLLSYGIVAHKSGYFEEAILSYKLASILNPNDPEPLFYTASAFVDLNDIANARLTFDQFVEMISNTGLYEPWGEQMNYLRNRIH